MSDLLSGAQPHGSTSRAQNGGSRPAQGTAATPAEPPRYRTPTDVMRERRLREARKAEQQEAERLRQAQQEEIIRRQEESAGVEGDNTRRPGPARTEGQGYTIGGTAAPPPAASGRRQENVQPTPQARPSNTQQQSGFAPGHARLSSNTQRNRTEAYDTLNVPATAKPTQQQSQQKQPPPTFSGNPQPSAPTGGSSKAAFPHAFERWETLSSHWEGLTSYWIRRLQENTNELNGKPLDQQLSRQITDLSAAGANLFHAVVELQRLRASSERKFQRWFFETRNEQEQAAERQADLERQLRAEREARVKLESMTSAGSADAVRAERAKAEEMVREMKRELQISKEEARRAWEELGRREQEERERTLALRSGEPTAIGGVQVVPMQGIPGRGAGSVQRPQTRDGTYPGGPSATTLGGMQPPPLPGSRSQTTTTSLDSPGEEHRQFSYQPHGDSPTSTDPFHDTARPATSSSGGHQLRHEPDTQFYSASQPPTSSAAMAAAQISTTNGQHFYQQPSPQTTIHQPLPSAALAAPQPPRSTTAQSSGRSYIPSTTGSSIGEEEYHINPDGSYTRDAHGRRIPYTQPILASPEVGEIDPAEHDHDSDEEEEEDYASDIARERMYAQQYASSSPSRPPVPQNQPPRDPTSLPPPQAARPIPPRSSPSALPSIPQGRVSASTTTTNPASTSIGSTSAGSADPQTALAPADYEGSAYGSSWEGVTPRHRHPTRLSDIIEENASRTSPSRGSFVSGSGSGAVAGAGAGAYYPGQGVPQYQQGQGQGR